MVNLYINQRLAGDVTVLDFKGRPRMGGNAVALHSSIRCLVQEKKTLILLNLTGVNFIDSCGLGELIASQVSVENHGGEIKLVGLTETLRELLMMTRLLTFFDVYESEADAISNFSDRVLRVRKAEPAFA